MTDLTITMIASTIGTMIGMLIVSYILINANKRDN